MQRRQGRPARTLRERAARAWRAFREEPGEAPRPCDTTGLLDRARPSALVREVFEAIRPIPGWFNVDDCAHFELILRLQHHLGLRGDLLEIGTYHGRSACLLARCAGRDEKLVLCDAFEGDTNDPYADKPSPERLLANLRRVAPDFDPERAEVHACLSRDLVLAPTRRFRFLHVDGGHEEAACFADLELCRRHVLPGGVIAVDDYDHPSWPGVTPAVDRFLRQEPAFHVLADLNRHGALGRKIYLAHAFR